MRITLLTPPPLDGKPVAERVAGCAYGLYPVPNIFELTTAAVLERDGHDVRYLNFPIEGEVRPPFNEWLKKDDSDLYAFYTVNLTKDTDRIATSKIREFRGNAHVVFYGPSPTYNPDEFIGDSNTYVVRGEPEESFSELVKTLDAENSPAAIPGISSKNDKIVHAPERPLIEDTDSLPFPARHLIRKDLYYNPKLGLKPFTAVYASRNCRFKCVYCVPCSLSFARELEYRRNHDGKKPPVKARSAQNVIDEILQIHKEGYRSMMFLDDQFIWEEDRTVQICEGIKHTGIIWGCASRADFITDRVVSSMAAANCRFIDIGVESFDQRILDDVRKGLKVERIEQAVKIIRSHGIDAKINILVGCSSLETKETIRANRKKVKEIGVSQVMYNIANPFPGTELYDIAKRDNWFVDGEYRPADVQKESIIRLPNLSAKELVSEVRKANFSFFLSPRFILSRIVRFRSITDFVDAFKALRKKLF